RVKYWEIWNEPIYVFTPSFYASMLQRAANAIRTADPTAKIVAMGGTYSYSWIVQVLTLLGTNWRSSVDIISTHLYPATTDPSTCCPGETGDAFALFKSNVIDAYQVPVWNTETGVWDQGFYKGTNSDFVRWGESFFPYFDSDRYQWGSHYGAEVLALNFLHSIGNSFSGYFYYDSRIFATPAYLRNHPTTMEYDDTIRSKGVVYAVLASFFGHAQGLGNISPDPNTYAYLFNTGGIPTVALWSANKTRKTITLSVSTFTAYDMMGNALTVAGNTIPYGRQPVYV